MGGLGKLPFDLMSGCCAGSRRMFSVRTFRHTWFSFYPKAVSCGRSLSLSFRGVPSDPYERLCKLLCPWAFGSRVAPCHEFCRGQDNVRPCSHAQCGLAGLSDAVDRSRNPRAARPQSDYSRITVGLQSDIQSDYSRTTVLMALQEIGYT